MRRDPNLEGRTAGQATSGTQRKQGYNTFGQLGSDAQQHSGAVDANSPKVQYTYSDGSDGHARLTKVTYPNGRYLHVGYVSSGYHDDELSRVSWLADDNGSGSPSGTKLTWAYRMGLDQIVRLAEGETWLLLDLAHGAGDDPCDGPLDRFDRTADLRWRKYAWPDMIERVQILHGYDRASNRMYRDDVQGASQHLDELYTYDGAYQLTKLERGDLNQNKDAISNKNLQDDWTLDATGNWSGYQRDSDADITQTRTHSRANEVMDISSTPTWAEPTYDRAGNTTAIPKPSAPADSWGLTYDAWNRLVYVEEGDVAEFRYDGLNRRTFKLVGADTRHYYYSSQWQVLEEQKDASTSVGSARPTTFDSRADGQ